MTPRKLRKFVPYTNNVKGVSLGTHYDSKASRTNPQFPLNNVLERYFAARQHQAISTQVQEAVATYYMTFRTNPDREKTEEQRQDRRVLLYHLDGVWEFLDPIHLPQPLMDGARPKYSPHALGKSTLGAEIRELLLRLHHLKVLFEQTEIPRPTRTNPGKHERTALCNALHDIFDANIGKGRRTRLTAAEATERERDCIQFVLDVFKAYHLTPPPGLARIRRSPSPVTLAQVLSGKP